MNMQIEKNILNAETDYFSDIKAVELSILALKSTNPSDGEFKDQVVGSLRSVGWSGETRISPDSRNYIHGTLSGAGLVVHLGNNYTIHRFILTLEQMYRSGIIETGIIVTRTVDEAKRWNRLRQPNSSSTGNFCETDTLIPQIEEIEDLITIPLLVLGIESVKV
tara:strand:+ start:359 stop:850 length:492 start_codon:yes stop_codon:yes gene_type:complete